MRSATNFVAAAMLLVASCAAAQERDRCQDVLAAGIHRQYSQQWGDVEQEAKRVLRMTDKEFGDYMQKQARERKGGGSIGAWRLKASGSGSSVTTASERSLYQRLRQRAEGEEFHLSTADFVEIFRDDIDPAAIEAWRECMARPSRGLLVDWAMVDSHAHITLSWQRHTEGAEERVSIRSVQLVNLEGGDDLKDGKIQIPTGGEIVRVFKVVNPKSAALAIFETSAGSKVVHIPATTERKVESVEARIAHLERTVQLQHEYIEQLIGQNKQLQDNLRDLASNLAAANIGRSAVSSPFRRAAEQSRYVRSIWDQWQKGDGFDWYKADAARKTAPPGGDQLPPPPR